MRREVDRLADRLRSLGPVRLATPWEPGRPGPADVAHDLARHLARLAEEAEALAAGRAARHHPLPRLGDHAVGDQVAVTGHDLEAALAALPEAHEQARRDWCVEGTGAVRALNGALP